MGSFSITHWLILLVVVVVVFGTSKLKNAGKDLGGAVKGFKEAVKDENAEHANKHRVLTHDTSTQASDHASPTQASPTQDSTQIDNIAVSPTKTDDKHQV